MVQKKCFTPKDTLGVNMVQKKYLLKGDHPSDRFWTIFRREIQQNVY